MAIDARPFLLLTTESGATVKCARVEVLILAIGLGGSGSGAVTDNATHRVVVWKTFGPVPGDLVENARVNIDGASYTVVRNGIQNDPGSLTVYLRAVREAVRP